GGRHDRARDFRRKLAGRQVGGGGGFLDEDVRGDQLLGRVQAADGKVFGRALGLNSVIRALGNVVVAERIAFCAAHGPSLPPSSDVILSGCFPPFSTACSSSS